MSRELDHSQIDGNYNGTLFAVSTENENVLLPLLVDPITGELLCEMDNGDVIEPTLDKELLRIDGNYNGVNSAYDDTNNEVRPLICASPMNGEQVLPISLLCDAIEVGI